QYGGCRYRKTQADPASSKTLACAEAFCTGTGRSPSLSPPVVAGTLSGRPEAVADDECDGEVGPARGSEEAGEQSGLSRCGARGAKGRGQEAVTRNRQDELTALLHYINIDVLRTSFFGLKNAAAPGVDEM